MSPIVRATRGLAYVRTPTVAAVTASSTRRVVNIVLFELCGASQVERQMVVARAATLEREIRHYENLIRLREVEKTPESTTMNAAPPATTAARPPPENPHLAQT